jgi:hypothetical protein
VYLKIYRKKINQENRLNSIVLSITIRKTETSLIKLGSKDVNVMTEMVQEKKNGGATDIL